MSLTSPSPAFLPPDDQADQRAEKRRKTTRACDICKARKKRCTGTRPCPACVKSGKECTYLANYTRGRCSPPPPHSDTYSKESPEAGTTAGSDDPYRLQSSATFTSVNAIDQGPLLNFNHGPALDHVHGRQLSRASSHINRLPSVAFSPNGRPQHAGVELPETLSANVVSLTDSSNTPIPAHHHDPPQHEGHSLDQSRRPTPDAGGTDFAGSYLGPTSAISWLQRAWKRLDQAHEDFSNHLKGDVWNNASIFTHGDKIPPTVSPGDDASELPPRSVAEGLLTRYFEFASPTYRFLHRQTVSGWLDQIYDTAAHAEKKISPGRQGVVFMVLANGSLYHTIAAGAPTQAATEDRLKTERLFAAAQKKLNAETGAPTLESVQARLAQCLYLLSSSRPNQAWFTCGTVVQLSMALGLHRKRSAGEGASLVVRECQKRTFWALYTLDKYLSVIFGRPRLLQDEDIDQEFPQPVNDEDLTPTSMRIPGRDDCLMDAPIFHAELAQIVGKASREQYAPGFRTTDQRFALATAHNRSLEEWKARLPPFLSGAIRPSSLIPILRRQSTVLTLAYAHGVMLVNRPLLLSNFSKPRRGGVAQHPLFQRYVQDCVDAAQDVAALVMQFVEEQQMFEAFWYTQYIAFNALSIIYLYIIQCHRHRTLSSSQKEVLKLAETCQQHLAEATRTNAPSLRYAIILEELRLEVHRQLDHVSPPQQAPNVAKDTTAAPGQQAGTQMGASTSQPNTIGSIVIPQGGQTPGGLPHDAFDDTLSADTDGIDWSLDFWPQLDSLPLSYSNWFDDVGGDLDNYQMPMTEPR